MDHRKKKEKKLFSLLASKKEEFWLTSKSRHWIWKVLLCNAVASDYVCKKHFKNVVARASHDYFLLNFNYRQKDPLLSSKKRNKLLDNEDINIIYSFVCHEYQ